MADDNQLLGSAEINTKYMDRYEIVCDMGEGFGKWKMGPDADIMPLIDVANVACGFHAGDFNIMRETVQMAKKYGVKVGSHPGLPDMMGFGRRKWDIPAAEIYNMVLYQTGALKAFLDEAEMPLNHIKPHGELYFYVERDETVMRAVLKVAKVFKVPVVGAKNYRYEQIAKEEGVDFIQEFYADIDWNRHGKLIPVSKSRPKNPDIIYDIVTKAGFEDEVNSSDGNDMKLNFGEAPFMLCLHSDMRDALGNIRRGREAINALNLKKGYTIRN